MLKNKIELLNEIEIMLTVTDIQAHLHLGRESAYALVKLPSFPSIKIGRYYLIPLSEYKKRLAKSVGKEYIIR